MRALMQFRSTIERAVVVPVLAASITFGLRGFVHGQPNIPGGVPLPGGLYVIPVQITPAATSAAIQTAEQTFTVTGVNVGDYVTVSPQVAATSLCPPVYARVSAANTVAIGFTVLTAAACTPAAGLYYVFDAR